MESCSQKSSGQTSHRVCSLNSENVFLIRNNAAIEIRRAHGSLRIDHYDVLAVWTSKRHEGVATPYKKIKFSFYKEVGGYNFSKI